MHRIRWAQTPVQLNGDRVAISKLGGRGLVQQAMCRQLVEGVLQQRFVIWTDLKLGLSRAQPFDSAHHMRSGLSARRWSTDPLIAVRTAASMMCSLIGFPPLWQAPRGGDQLPLGCSWGGDGGAVGRGLALAGCTASCRE